MALELKVKRRSGYWKFVGRAWSCLEGGTNP
jgi:hypothetical protein